MSEVFHISNCPVCGSSDFQTVHEVVDWLVSEKVFAVKACNSCSFRFTQDAPTEKEVGPYYDTDSYVEHSDTKKGLVFTLYHYGRQFMLNSKLRLVKRLGKHKSLLDIGSASGYFLDHMKKHGYEVNGVEISEKARQLCKEKFDIDVYEPSALLDKSLEQKFDIISLWHVFEHVYTYNEYFEAFDRLLSTNGRLLIAMPNYQSVDAKHYGAFWNAYDVPRHLWHFDYASFERFAKDRGFSIEKAKLLPLDPFYNAMVSAEFKTKRSFVLSSLFVGLWSFLSGLLNKKKASSLVYVLSKD